MPVQKPLDTRARLLWFHRMSLGRRHMGASKSRAFSSKHFMSLSTGGAGSPCSGFGQKKPKRLMHHPVDVQPHCIKRLPLPPLKIWQWCIEQRQLLRCHARRAMLCRYTCRTGGLFKKPQRRGCARHVLLFATPAPKRFDRAAFSLPLGPDKSCFLSLLASIRIVCGPRVHVVSGLGTP